MSLHSLVRAVRHPVAANSLAILFLRGTTIGARLIALFLIARFASPVEFGYVAFGLSIAEIAKVIADFGLDTFSVRELAITQDVKAKQRFLSILAFTKLLCGLLVYIILLIFFVFRQDIAPVGIMAILGLLVLTGLWSNLTITYFQAHLRVNEIIVPVIVTNIISIFIIALLSVFKPNILLGLVVLPVAETINMLILLQHLRREVTLTREKWQLAEVLKLLHRGLPIAVTVILVTLYTRLDVVVLKSFLGAEAVAYYSIAFRMTEPFLFIASALGSSMYSHVSTTLINNSISRARFLLTRYATGLLFYGLICCILLTLIAPIVINRLLPDYSPAIPILQILALALIFRTVNIPLNSTILAFGRFAIITYVAIFNLILISASLFYFVPQYGAQGAAFCLLIGEGINTGIHLAILTWIFVRKKQNYSQ